MIHAGYPVAVDGIPAARIFKRSRSVLLSFTTGVAVTVHAACGQAPGPVAPGAVPDPGFLGQYAATYHFRLGRPASIKPAPDGRAILFLRSGPRSFQQDLYDFDVATGKERVLLTAEQLLGGAAEHLTPEERARRERMRIAARGITSFQLSKDGSRVLVPLSGRLFVLDRSDESLREVPSVDGGPPETPRLSPDGKRIAYVREGDLYVVDVAGGPALRLTDDAGPAITNGLAEFVAQEEMGRHSGFWWSPDSTRIAVQQTDTAAVEELTVADLAQPEQPAQRFAYPRPGRNNADVRLGIVSIQGGPRQWVEWDRERYPYLAAVTWEENAPLTLLLQNRRQTQEVLASVSPADGSINVLLTEQDDAWINLEPGMPHWFRDGSAFLWSMERNGALQMEVHEPDGRLRHVVTPLSAGLQNFVSLDEKRKWICVEVSADPTETHLERISLDPGGPAPQRLSEEPGLHGAVFSENGDVFVHTYSGMTTEWIKVRRSDGGLVGELTSVAETPRLGLDLSATVTFTTVGDPALHAVLIKPRDFAPHRAYPVIVHVYGGPGSQMVRRSARYYLLDQWIADHGYIVASIDGRGTGNRGHDWQRTVKNDVISLPLQDTADALKELGRTFDSMDLSRVGIYGWSFGGYFSALAVMRRPDVFRAGVAGAPVADWLDYDTHYTERYMGLPADNPSGYRDASALTWAGDLSAALLIIHGTSDDNVYFLHSLRLADALFRAGKPFEMLPLAGFTHMVPDPVVTERLYGRIMGFFQEILRP